MAEKNGKSAFGAEILRFALTGGVCFLVEFAALVLLRDGLGLDTLVATPIAFLVSVILNYLLCVVWVFQGTRDAGAAAKAGFILTSVAGLFLNEGFMLLFRLLFGEDTVVATLMGRAVSMYMINKCLATGLVMIWNYITKKKILTSGLAERIAEKFRKKGQDGA